MNRDVILLNPIVRFVAQLTRFVMRIIDPYGRTSYAQEGEDLVLERFFGGMNRGFYVDVGAHHPLRFSNTYLLYRRGWRGINIDAMPGSMGNFRRLRPSDINVESAVALQDAHLKYHVFKERALNTFDKDLAEQYVKSGLVVVSQLEIRARPLADLLDEYLPTGQGIDLITVDVEGLDLDVLRSNDWQRFRPRVVLVEELRQSAGGANVTVRDFLTSLGYSEFARTYNSVFYVADGERI